MPIGLVSIAPGTVLGSPQLVHLGHTLLELFVLALFVAVSLVLLIKEKGKKVIVLVKCANGFCRGKERRVDHGGVTSYLALPRQVILCLSAPVQRDEQVGTRVPVLDRQASVRHLLVGGS